MHLYNAPHCPKQPAATHRIEPDLAARPPCAAIPIFLIVLHWLTALFILAAWFVAEGGRSATSASMALHMSLGLSVLMLVCLRLVARLTGTTPGPAPGTEPALHLAAQVGHGLLYLMMIGLPLSGWYTASLMGFDITLFGLHLPTLSAAVPGRPGLIAELHENGGTFILILGGLHGLAALWHQFVRRDGTLARMNPFRTI